MSGRLHTSVTLLIVKPITITIMNDRTKHIFAGMLIAVFIGIPCYVNTGDLFSGLWACLAGVIAGGVKEWCDTQMEWNGWSWKNFGWTCLGVAWAMLFIILLHFGRG